MNEIHAVVVTPTRDSTRNELIYSPVYTHTHTTVRIRPHVSDRTHPTARISAIDQGARKVNFSLLCGRYQHTQAKQRK